MTKRILVIDDEAGVREIMQICLEAAAGWEVLTAASGREGLAIAQAQQPDAILLDVMMPDMDGPTTFRQLQANEAISSIPTILVTAKAGFGEQKQLLDLGVNGVVTKPFTPEYLVAKICKILNWKV